MNLPFYGKKRKKIDQLRLLAVNVDLYLRTVEGKLIQIQTAFETLRNQNEEIIKILKERKQD